MSERVCVCECVCVLRVPVGVGIHRLVCVYVGVLGGRMCDGLNPSSVLSLLV